MNREIKFKFWDPIDKEFYVAFPNMSSIPPHSCKGNVNEVIANLIKLGVGVSQYTGLKDKNGTEIYEGDILRVDDIYNNSNNEILNVIFDLDLASFESISKTDRYSDESLYEIHEFAIIIGNIYETP